MLVTFSSHGPVAMTCSPEWQLTEGLRGHTTHRSPQYRAPWLRWTMVVFANMDSKLEPWNEQHVGGTQYARFYELNSFVFSYLLAFRCIPVIVCFSGFSQETIRERLGPLYIVINIQKKLEALKRGKFMSVGGFKCWRLFFPKGSLLLRF